MNRRLAPLTCLAFAALAALACAEGSADMPPITNWITDPVTPIAHEVRSLTIFASILILPFFFGPVIALLYAIHKFDARRNPVPAKWHENLPLEIAWTVLPAFILVVVAFRAYPVLVTMDNPGKEDLRVNVTGQQFFWQYEYPRYDVTVVDDGSGKSPLILPVDKVVTLRGSATQVNHAWWVPAFGVKFDVIPGRIARGWVKVEREGFFKGQCAELCGTGHAAMLIHVKVVSDEEFRKFILSKNPAAKFDEPEVAAAAEDSADGDGTQLAALAGKEATR